MKSHTLILGHGRHGKDTFADMVRAEYGSRFIVTSSSLFAASRVIMPSEFAQAQGYTSADAAFASRHHHRAEWFRLIQEYNAADPTRLARDMRDEGASCYIGMRSTVEFDACLAEGLFTHVVWVERPGMPLESIDSFDLGARPWGYVESAAWSSGASALHVCNASLAGLRRDAGRFADKLRLWDMVSREA